MGHTHRMNDQFPSESGLSDSQFEALTDMLSAQHDALMAALAPIQEVALQVLADREAATLNKAEKSAEASA
jgi:hypothetical protein